MTRKGNARRRASVSPAPWFFYPVLALLPILLLAGIEGGLRLTGVARPEPFFLEHRTGAQSILQINPKIGSRFFPPSLGTGVPVPNFQVFSAAKRPGVRRIFCLGESTTAGFPFPVTGSFPALLRELLRERSPEIEWEVVNAGLTGISSHTVAAIVPEILVKGSPDLLVVYMGHNEFFGVGGVASRGFAAGGAIASLQELRIVRVLQGLLARGDPDAEPGTLMERIVGKSSIPPGSPVRERAYRAFRKNIERILSAAADRRVPVVLCEVVSNERDLYPFGPGTAGLVPAWRSRRLDPKTAAQALPELDRAVASDSLDAGLRYLRGITALAVGRSDAARELRAARNLDAVPFRAPDPINRIIREEGQRAGVPVVATERQFRTASGDGSMGHESFVEHLHPTFLGNARIASLVADEILQRPGDPVDAESAGSLLLRSGLTPLDLALGDGRIGRLLARWPYARTGGKAAPFAYEAASIRLEAAAILQAAGETVAAQRFEALDPEVPALVDAMIRKRLDLLQAHKRLGTELASRGDLEGAALEIRAAALLFPVDVDLHLSLGALHQKLGNRDGAAEAARAALEYVPTSPPAQELLRWATAAAAGEGSRGRGER